MAYIPASGSVVAFEGTNPWIVTGSVQSTAAPNQSVSGATQLAGASPSSIAAVMQLSTPINSSTMSLVTQTVIHGLTAAGGGSYVDVKVDPSGAMVTALGSVVAFQGTSPWAISSVYGNVSGSVVSYQGTNPWIITGSVQTTVNTGNSSVQLLGGSAAIGSVTALQGTNPWTVTGFPTNQNVSGSVISFQGTTPWVTVGSVYGSGSVVAFQGGTQITSVSGTVNNSPGADTYSATSSVLVGVTANTNGSVATVTGYQMAMMQITSGPGASMTGVVNFEGTMDGTQFVPLQGYNVGTGAISSMATVEGNWAFNTAGLQGIRGRVSNWSIGSITARVVSSPEDARPFTVIVDRHPSVYGNVSGSVIAFQGAGWSGSVAATITNTNINVSGSVAAFVQGNASVITLNQGSSILSVPVGSTIALIQGSVAAVQSGTWRPSTAAMYATGSASIVSALGDLTLGVRNDTLASVFGLNAAYGPTTVGSWGDQIVSFAPSSVWTAGTASCFTGVEQPVITSVVGRKVNVTGVQIVNTSANNVYMTFYGAGIGSVTGSIIAYTAAPANGGSNINYPIPLQTANNSGFSASVSGVASVFVSAQGFYSAV